MRNKRICVKLGRPLQEDIHDTSSLIAGSYGGIGKESSVADLSKKERWKGTFHAVNGQALTSSRLTGRCAQAITVACVAVGGLIPAAKQAITEAFAKSGDIYTAKAGLPITIAPSIFSKMNRAWLFNLLDSAVSSPSRKALRIPYRSSRRVKNSLRISVGFSYFLKQPWASKST